MLELEKDHEAQRGRAHAGIKWARLWNFKEKDMCGDITAMGLAYFTCSLCKQGGKGKLRPVYTCGVKPLQRSALKEGQKEEEEFTFHVRMEWKRRLPFLQLKITMQERKDRLPFLKLTMQERKDIFLFVSTHVRSRQSCSIAVRSFCNTHSNSFSDNRSLLLLCLGEVLCVCAECSQVLGETVSPWCRHSERLCRFSWCWCWWVCRWGQPQRRPTGVASTTDPLWECWHSPLPPACRSMEVSTWQLPTSSSWRVEAREWSPFGLHSRPLPLSSPSLSFHCVVSLV